MHNRDCNIQPITAFGESDAQQQIGVQVQMELGFAGELFASYRIVDFHANRSGSKGLRAEFAFRSHQATVGPGSMKSRGRSLRA